MIKRIKYWLCGLMPKIHNLPQVIYIKWLGYEWIVKKELK